MTTKILLSISIFILIFLFIYIKIKYFSLKKLDNNVIKWNLTKFDDKIILYSTNYKYLILLTKQTNKDKDKNNNNNIILSINIKYRNDLSELRTTDYDCDILKTNNIFSKDNYLILNNDSDRFNIISYLDLPEIYKFDKKESNPYYSNPHFGFYDTCKSIEEIIGKAKKITITENIINNFVTKETFYFPEYMVLY